VSELAICHQLRSHPVISGLATINLPTTRMSELSAWVPDQWKLAQAARLASLQNQAPYVALNMWFP
jgi:hypothetical protein